MSDFKALRRRWMFMGAFAAALLVAASGFYVWANHFLKQQLLVDATLALDLKDYGEALQLIRRIRAEAPELSDGQQLEERLLKQLVQEAGAAVTGGNPDRAKQLVEYIQATDPTNPHGLLMAGQIAIAEERWEDAERLFRPLLDGKGFEAVAAHSAIGNLRLQESRASEAEEHFRRALQLDPANLFAANRMALLLTIEGRRWEGRPFMFEFLRSGQFTFNDLQFLAHPGALMKGDMLEDFRRGDPEDPLPMLGEARIALRDNEWRKAEKLLQYVLEKRPQLIEAQVRMGEVLLEKNAPPTEFVKWEKALPETAENHPDLWVVRGLWARNQDQNDAAIRCFWEAVLRDPDNQVANYQLAQCLSAAGKHDEAQPFERRAQLLQELEDRVDETFNDSDDLEVLKRTGELLEELGRYWEAWGWYAATSHDHPEADWALQGRERMAKQLDAAVPRIVPQKNPVLLAVSYSELPKPRYDLALPARQADPNASPDAPVTFAEVTKEAGIEFTYFNADDPATEGRRMFEFTGGGITVIDFDSDGWPDLYFTQGCEWPPQPNRTEYYDRLYRNLGNGKFEDVTERAGLGDNLFTQGAAAGDVNNDGFPDLLVGNVGENHLYLNNGDGTFSDVSVEAGIQGDFWTTSCLIADLNGDGLADLYEVNYLDGNNVFGLICDRGGRARTCSPTVFDGQDDRMFLNLGDGRFADRTKEAGITPEIPADGKGLGIVAADFDGSGRLSMFVANDTAANFYFTNQGVRGSEPQFREEAVVLGLSHDRDGKTQACMGIAVDDADADGLLDMFVTNFFSESNTYYGQQEGHYFRDDTRKRGLRDPSYNLLGFGTQFIDGELDGWPDLVLTNGHVDDFTHMSIPFRMRPQYMRNTGGQFVEVMPEQLGKFFQGEYLGRGLSRVDFNRDGLEEFVVSHLDSPAALVANTTKTSNHHLTVHLRGRTCERDAIGATVEVTIGDKTRTRQMTAGDGYLASNHRQLIFGLGEATSVDKLVVRWPSGVEQTFTAVAGDQEVLIIEGHEEPYSLPR